MHGTVMRHFEIPKSVLLALAVLIAAAGVLHMPKVAHFTGGPWPYDGYDLRVFWIAGKLWASGQNPYGAAFTTEYLAAFGEPTTQSMVYPPFWFPIAVPFSFLSFPTVCMVWRLLDCVLLVAATGMMAQIFAEKARVSFWTIFLGGLGFVALMQSTSLAFALGQTSIVLYFGLAAVFCGLSRKNPWVLLTGLVAVALKPNIGAIAYVLVAMMPEWRRTLALAVGILILAAVPVVLLSPSDSFPAWLTNLSEYYGFPLAAHAPDGMTASEWLHVRGGNWPRWASIRDGDWIEFVANSPMSMTGLVHFTDGLPTGLMANVLVAAAAVAALIVWRLGTDEELTFVRLTLVVLLLAPLHVYDMSMLAIPAMFVWSRGAADPRLLPAVAGLLICWRPGNITEALNITPEVILRSQGPLIATVGLLLVAIPFLIPGAYRREETKGSLPSRTWPKT
jgi:hypothetical protein